VLQRMAMHRQRQRISELEKQVDALKEALARVVFSKSDDVLMSTKEIAPYVGVSHPKTVERWVREKGLPCVRIGRNLRFRLGDVLRWLAQRKES
jgi:excisionase family DNA binding protein